MSGIHKTIYIKHYGKIPLDEEGRAYDIHHIDGNHTNNDPKNLKAVSILEHYNIHYKQHDWGACAAIAARMAVKPQELSKISSRAKKGGIWITNNILEKYVKDHNIPAGWHRGRLLSSVAALNHKGETNRYSLETLQKMSLAKKGKSTWNKGLTKETDERVMQNAIALRGISKSSC